MRSGDQALIEGTPTVLWVDLDAIICNFKRMQALAGVPVMPVVKAAGYGIDGTRVALELQQAGAQCFAVAYPNEGIELRARGIEQPILVQNVVPAEIHKVVRHGLSVQVSDLGLFDALEQECARQHRGTPVHLKVDSGMGRAGCAPDQAVAIASRVVASPWCTFEGLMTHFAASDDPVSDDFTRLQIARFDQVLASLPVQPRWVHASNSAAIARFPEARYNMVRSGLGLYGYGGPTEQQPVLRLETRIVTVKTVGAGQTVGYARAWSAGEDRRIAVVAIGYGDGYPWSLSNRGWMMVHGVRCPVVGRVCMDVSMLDVTDAGAVQPGDRVMVFGGDGPDLVDLASAARTIPYELLTRLTPRVRRIFETSR